MSDIESETDSIFSYNNPVFYSFDDNGSDTDNLPVYEVRHYGSPPESPDFIEINDSLEYMSSTSTNDVYILVWKLKILF